MAVRKWASVVAGAALLAAVVAQQVNAANVSDLMGDIMFLFLAIAVAAPRIINA